MDKTAVTDFLQQTEAFVVAAQAVAEQADLPQAVRENAKKVAWETAWLANRLRGILATNQPTM